MKTDECSVDAVRDLLNYDPNTGVFRWKRDRSNVKAGSETGCIAVNGYVIIRLMGKARLAHRLAWMHVHGEMPPKLIDHINGDKKDNRIENLRAGTKVTNGQNRHKAQVNNKSSGLLGVSYIKHTGKFTAYIDVGGRRTYFGLYENKEDAHAVYLDAKRKMHEGCTI